VDIPSARIELHLAGEQRQPENDRKLSMIGDSSKNTRPHAPNFRFAALGDLPGDG
jgi:hypothetical protein